MKDTDGEDDMQPSADSDSSSPAPNSSKDDSGEPDEMPQEPKHPTITRPAPAMQRTAEALSILGAGQPYINRNK